MGAAEGWTKRAINGHGGRPASVPLAAGRDAPLDGALALGEVRGRRNAAQPRFCTTCAAQETPLHRAPCNACAAPDFAAWRPMSGPAGGAFAAAAGCVGSSAASAPRRGSPGGRPEAHGVTAGAGIARWAASLGALVRRAASHPSGAPERGCAAADSGSRPEQGPVRSGIVE